MRPLLTSLAALVLLSGPASAQWPAGQGGYWGKVSFFSHRTTEEFRSNGDQRPFLNNEAVSLSRAVFADALVGVTDRLDLWVQVPYFDLSFNDAVETRESSGFGDIRASARLNLFSLRGGAMPVSVRFTTKAPIADLTIDAEIIPLGEGQWGLRGVARDRDLAVAFPCLFRSLAGLSVADPERGNHQGSWR